MYYSSLHEVFYAIDIQPKQILIEFCIVTTAISINGLVGLKKEVRKCGKFINQA